MSQKRKMLRLKDLKDIFNFDNFFSIKFNKICQKSNKIFNEVFYY